MSEYIPITTDMRLLMGCFTGFTDFEKGKFTQMCDAIDSVHAALEAECERLREQDHDGWVELPKDADGVPIHIGDVLERRERHGEVIALMLSDNPWGNGNHWAIQLEGEHAPTVFDSLFHRYVPDTWERIIGDAVNVHGNGFNPCWTDERDALVARCKALAGDAE